jgi:hypothetical protein
MASQWIKIEHTTPDKPEVFQIADMLGIDPDAVVGKLVRVWIWADQQTRDGNAPSVTSALLDRISCVTGFADALQSVGWLDITTGGIHFCNFDRHNGNSCKTRALSAKRVETHREVKRKCNGDSVTKALLEKRREEKNSNTETQDANASTIPVVVKQDAASVNAPKNRSKAFEKPTVQQIIGYVQEIGSTVDAKSFWDYYESNGWRVGRNPMKDWRATVRQWQSRNHQGNGNGGTQRLTTSQHRENANASAFNSIRAAIAASGD